MLSMLVGHDFAVMQVRSAVRALTLNVYSIEDEKVQNFVCSKPHSAYFQELAISIVDQCQVCPCLQSAPCGTPFILGHSITSVTTQNLLVDRTRPLLALTARVGMWLSVLH